MFFEALIIAIIIGYLFKGKLKNLQYVTLHKSYLVFIAFSLEAIIIISIRKHFLIIGLLTFMFDLIMYAILFSFIYFNRKDKWILIIGFGFLLNALPIFFNGGAMPVSLDGIKAAGLDVSNVSAEGLYSIINSNTNLWFLGDIFPKTFLRNFVISIGDIISAFALMLYVITGMRRNQPLK